MAVTTEALEITLLHPDARPPARTRPGDVGYDLCCVEAFQLWPGRRATVPTGVAVAVPEGAAGLVVPRSGLASRHGITVVNGPGLIDPNYRGEVKVVLVNLGSEPYRGEAGDRIAQLLLVPCLTPEIAVVDRLAPASDERGENGFGSSGR
jgi:dUTP pyrophosphatase